MSTPHESKPWNPIIANVFYRAGIIERWGSGMLNIMDWCKENANPLPTWNEQTSSVYVTFLPAVLPEASRSGPSSRAGLTPSLSQVCTRSVSSSTLVQMLALSGISMTRASWPRRQLLRNP